MKQALWQLLNDFLSTILFVLVYALSGSLFAAAGVAVAAVMLRRGWMIRYLPEVARRNVSEAIVVVAGYAWAGLLAALGLANLVIAFDFDFATWAWFVSVGAIGAKVAAFALQYAVFRAIVRQRLAQPAT